jgi:ferric-dicitrate binding protein FerR (iron transport regulator)
VSGHQDHVAPDRWALLASGELTEAERVVLETHLHGCAACTEARRRVLSARRALHDLAAAPPPEPNWERLGARLHWTVSSESRRREREREVTRRRWWNRRLFPFALGGAALAAAGVVALVLASGGDPSPGEPAPRVAEPARSVVPAPVVDRSTPPPAPPAPVKTPLEGVVTLLAGEAVLDGAPLGDGAAVRAGATIVTDGGRVAVQFGERSGFVLEPGSTLELASFDDANVELRVSGAVTVEVAKRRPGQRLAVIAGARSVEVRGTMFRVAHVDGDLDVTVTRGRVAVVEGPDAIEVPAGSRLALARAARVGSVLPAVMTERETTVMLARMQVPTIPSWTDPHAMRAQSAMLAVAARPKARVRIDGVEVGAGAVAVRTMPGRHLVEVGAVQRWVESEAGGRTDATFLDRGGTSERPKQVDDELERLRDKLERCGDSQRKYDPRFRASIEVEIGILANGDVNYVAPVRGYPEGDVEECILSVVRDQARFPSGSKAQVRKTIDF